MKRMSSTNTSRDSEGSPNREVRVRNYTLSRSKTANFHSPSPSSSSSSSSSSSPSSPSSPSSSFASPRRTNHPIQTYEFDDPFSCKDAQDNIILEEEEEGAVVQLIKAATVEKLVQRVTYEGIPDPLLLDSFLLTYRSFLTPHKLIDLLRQRFLTKCPETFSKTEFHEKFLSPVRLRILNLCKSWVSKYNDFAEDELLAKHFVRWMKELSEEPSLDKKQLKLIDELKKKVNKKGDVRMEARIQEKPKPLFPAPKSGARTLLDFSPVEVARQISLIEMAQYTKIQPWELLHRCWEDPNGVAVHVREMIAWSTRMSQLIATEVIKVPIEKKSQMLTHVIQIGWECAKLNNYNAVMEIIAGLNNSAVSRLQPFFKAVARKEQKQLKELKALLSPDKNFGAMRGRIKMAEPPVLPYLGIFLTDLTFIEESPDRVKNNLVNFKKCRLTSHIIRAILQYQQIDYNLEVVPEIRDFLMTGMIMDNKVLYKVSTKQLPKEAKESSVSDLKKKKRAEKKEGSIQASSLCRNTCTLEEVLRLLEEDEDYRVINLCGQDLSTDEMTKLAKILEKKENVHTLNLCHGAFADRHREEEWGWLSRLKWIQTLDFSHQDMVFVPVGVNDMPQLTHLNIQDNQLLSLPDFGQLQQLEELKCNQNQIVALPFEISLCKNLKTLNISSNKISCLPSFLADLPHLRYFYCSDNPIRHPPLPPALISKGGPDLLIELRKVGN